MLKMRCSGPLKSRRPLISSAQACHSVGFATKGKLLRAPLLNGLSSIPAFARMASVSDLHDLEISYHFMSCHCAHVAREIGRSETF